jgi:MSHA biogenesis protein MshK
VSKWLIVFVFLVAVILSQSIIANETLNDPTRPQQSYLPDSSKRLPSAEPLRLESILVSPNRKVAVINGVRVAEGDHVEGSLITRINSDSVAINSNGTRRVLTQSRIPDIKKLK